MAFIEKRSGELLYMNSNIISARHIFTTRHGGVSTGALASLNLGSNRGDTPENVRENYRRLCAFLGSEIDDCVVTRQVHGNEVRIVTEADKHQVLTRVPYDADGIVTNRPGLPIICFTADCVPVLLYDEVNRVAGAIHCGWRSSVSDILGNAIAQMKKLGAEEAHICAALGPAIGSCCFETDDDVPDAVTAYLNGETEGLFVRRSDGKTMVDLRGANRVRLLQLGLKEEHIDISPECTFCCHDKYWSHRYTKGVRGTQASAIVIE
ncbi:MAG: peptidoglycan editing factor PgeF [Oscillospiraceae bacterium]|nr:peptidoglycan editing factor PgeF [Oscillospiraceae bacterium]